MIENWLKDYTCATQGEYNLNKAIVEKCNETKDFHLLAKNYTHVSPTQIHEIFSKIHGCSEIINGKGLDLGGGPGIVASTLAKNFNCQIEFVELVSAVINIGYPIVEKYFGSEVNSRVVPIIGSFDDIKRADETYEFCYAWDAMHHSVNPTSTLLEAHRVTKKTGKFILIDRVHNNSVTSAKLDEMVNIQYGREWLVQNNMDPEIVFTRKDNGEHEYRFSDWEAFFEQASWRIIDKYMLIEKHERNLDYRNDFGAPQIELGFELGGYERRKLVLIAEKA